MSDLMQSLRRRVLNVAIDGDWSGNDFSALFEIVSSLYFLCLPYDDFDVVDTEFGVVLEPSSSLRVMSIKYGSPGQINLLGLGEVMKQIKEFIMYMMDRDLHREEKKLRNQLLRAQLGTTEFRKRLLERSRNEESLIDNWDILSEGLAKHLQASTANRVSGKLGTEQTNKFVTDHQAAIMQLMALTYQGKITNLNFYDEGQRTET
jgi:hypothetical protein